MHEGGWTLEILTDGSLRITDPNDQELGAPPSDWIGADEPGIAERNASRGIVIDEMTGIPKWYGESLDLDHAITALLSIRDPGFASYELAPACRPAGHSPGLDGHPRHRERRERVGGQSSGRTPPANKLSTMPSASSE